METAIESITLPSLPSTESALEQLLQARLDHPTQVDRIDAEIQQTFVKHYAIMNLDMSGFSRLTREHGIIPTLAEIQRMRNLVTPIVQQHQGTVIKYEADNIYSIYPTVKPALAAAIAILSTLATVEMYGSIGIGYGDLIMLTHEQQAGQYVNAYGNQMNLAAKLGEDLAEVNEILLTADAFAEIRSTSDRFGPWHEREVIISQVQFKVFGIERSTPTDRRN